MSRIGLKQISVPGTVAIVQSDHLLKVSGPKGEIDVRLPSGITVIQKDSKVTVSRNSELRQIRALHGTVRSLLSNAVTGVTEGFIKKLELVGIGYRAAIEDQTLVLQVGFTHPVRIIVPEGLEVFVDKNVIAISGIDRQKVGQFAAEIRQVRRPEPYKGKGIRYQGEKVRMKQGKAVKAAG